MQFDPLPVTVENVRRETQRDPVLAQVYEMSSKGWLHNLGPELNPYFACKDEITLQSDCLMWEIRVIVPPKLRPLARSYIWWPGIDKELELTVKSCSGCQLTQKVPGTVPVHPWEWPTKFCKQKCYF